ncbi:MAG TPA: DUF362 domain-containing protein [Polyangiaceae bacterium]|nr:DUF362 domain-containing protein [Polyangiaceae bacterium]
MNGADDPLTRRRFLEHASAALGAAALAAACDGDDENAGGSDSGSPGTARVSIVSRANLDEAVARAVELAGGLDAIRPGQTVFIKPNAVSDRAVGTAGIRTNPEVLAAVVRLVKERNPGRIIVGDRSARAFPDTDRVLRATGLRDAALSAGADEVYAARSPLEAPDEWLLLQPPHYQETWDSAGGLLAMRRIVEADHLINVPACKDHRYALFSMSMKNFVGAIGDATRGPLHFGSSTSGNFGPIGRDIAVMNQMFSPLLNVLDATTALVNGGPEGDSDDAVRATPGLICASGNRAALDALGVSLIRLELSRTTVPRPDAAHQTLRQGSVWRLPQIANAGALGFGVAGPDAVTLHFDDVDDAEELEHIFRA